MDCTLGPKLYFKMEIKKNNFLSVRNEVFVALKENN